MFLPKCTGYTWKWKNYDKVFTETLKEHNVNLFEELRWINIFPLENQVPLHPVTITGILGGYLYFVNKCGQEFMKDRKAYSLRYVMLTYNALQVVANIWLSGYVSTVK